MGQDRSRAGVEHGGRDPLCRAAGAAEADGDRIGHRTPSGASEQPGDLRRSVAKVAELEACDDPVL